VEECGGVGDVGDVNAEVVAWGEDGSVLSG
jgi:hypothetical protein